MSLQGKIWGTTKLIEANNSIEFHEIRLNAGGVCSKHHHNYKWNGFHVVKGILLIRVWQKDYDLVDETVLHDGEFTKVKPGLQHQFEALTDVHAFELYWAEFNHNDIVRETIGFTKSD